jgi:spore coat protein U-like protein
MVRIDAIRTGTAIAVLLLAGLCRPAQALLFCGGPLSSPVTVSATALSFGNYTPASAAAANATVTVRCGTLGINLLPSFTVSLISSNGANPSARYMRNGAAHLGYNIYTDAGYSAVWGDGTAGSLTQSSNSILALGSIAFTAWGRVPAGQYVSAGVYSDTVTVLVSY